MKDPRDLLLPLLLLPLVPGSAVRGTTPPRPAAKFEDLADGIIWQEPLRDYCGVTLIPLSEFAPDAKALAGVSDHSPFVDAKGASREELEKQWREQEAWLRDPRQTRGWKTAIPSCGP